MMKYLKRALCLALAAYLAAVIIFHFNDASHFLDAKIVAAVNILSGEDGCFKIDRRYIYHDDAGEYIYILENVSGGLYNQKICRRYAILPEGGLYRFADATISKFTAVSVDIASPDRRCYSLYGGS